jgi:hypothetical protein
MQTFKTEKTDSQYTATWRYYSDAVFIWFIILAGLTIWITLLVQVPLWGLALFFLALAIHTWSGKTKIVLDADGFNEIYTNLIRKREKRIALTDIRHFEKQVRPSTGKLSSSQYIYLFRVVCQNDRYSKSFGVPAKNDLEEEIDELCDHLNIFLGTLKAIATGVPAHWELPEPIVFDLDLLPQHLDLPPKSRWYYHTDFDGIGFRKKGKDNVRDILRSLYWAVRDNGIVCFFVWATFALLNDGPPANEGVWVGAFALLSPLVLYGLYRIGVLLYHLLEWSRTTTWMFARGVAEFRSVRFGSLRTEQHMLTDWDSLVVRLPVDEKISPVLIAVGNPHVIRDYYNACERWQLAFLNVAGDQLMEINELSKSEALWMADVILREQWAMR